MADTSTQPLLISRDAGPQVRMTTLVNLRWLAVIGQTVTVVAAALGFGLRFEVGLCLLAIGAAVVANLVAITIYAPSQRLRERDALAFLAFDLVQLAALLALTGGIDNPFALLFLAPVTISASVLSLRATGVLAGMAIGALTVLSFWNLPVLDPGGAPIALSPLLTLGFWTAIVVGTLFQAAFAYRLSRETGRMSDALLAAQTALLREQKLHDLGGVVAAAAHELGTPLATIKLVSSELVEELADRPSQAEDARLVAEQADRCRDILRSMGRAGKSDRQMEAVPLTTLLREAAEPHSDRGPAIVYDAAAQGPGAGPVPLVRRRPEVIHGLRNLVQNAVDFARETVWIDMRWSAESLVVRVIDDGDGYPPEVLMRLGDPFLRSRRRAGYEGMGLGLFIAKTLLERSGAELAFANGTPPGSRLRAERGGAIAEITWPVDRIAVPRQGRLGENAQIR
jgi:two-component system sensor histidine kinase RegB